MHLALLARSPLLAAILPPVLQLRLQSQLIISFGSRMGPRSTQYSLHCSARYLGIYDGCRVPQFHVRPFAINSSDHPSAGKLGCPVASMAFSFSLFFSSPSNLPEHQKASQRSKCGKGYRCSVTAMHATGGSEPRNDKKMAAAS